MEFHLGFQPKISLVKITHQEPLLLIGSCFSEHIGQRLSDLKFQVHSNPLGIVYNPSSIEKSLNRIIDKNYFNDNDVFEKDSFWFSLEAHSSVFADSKANLIKLLNTKIDEWNLLLNTASFLTITLGSAFAYKNNQQNKIVANCHKLPQELFEKLLLEPQDILSNYKILIEKLLKKNPKLNILFTVSPVKHLRDGLVENNLSKSILIQSIHQIIKHNNNCHYFPAYEIVNDDLRDYRFYEADMAHPNKLAIDYVWGKFSDVFFNETTTFINEQLVLLNQAYRHRFLNENSEASAKFKMQFHQKCLAFQSKFPSIDLSKELLHFTNYE
jgi:hypothetical protein